MDNFKRCIDLLIVPKTAITNCGSFAVLKVHLNYDHDNGNCLIRFFYDLKLTSDVNNLMSNLRNRTRGHFVFNTAYVKLRTSVEISSTSA